MTWFSCRRTNRLLMDYIDGELSGQPKADIEQHISGCANCRRLMAKMQAEADAAAIIMPLSPPADFTAKVMQQIRSAEVRRPTRWLIRPLSLAQAGWAAAAMLVIALGITYFAELRPLETLPQPSPEIVTRVPEKMTEQPQVETPQPTTPPKVAVSPAPKQVVTEAPTPERQIARQPRPQVAANRTERPRTRTQVARSRPRVQPAPEVMATETEQVTTALLDSAADAEESGELDTALVIYQEAARDPAARKAALFGAGRVYEKLGMDISALEALSEALSIENTSSGISEG